MPSTTKIFNQSANPATNRVVSKLNALIKNSYQENDLIALIRKHPAKNRAAFYADYVFSQENWELDRSMIAAANEQETLSLLNMYLSLDDTLPKDEWGRNELHDQGFYLRRHSVTQGMTRAIDALIDHAREDSFFISPEGREFEAQQLLALLSLYEDKGTRKFFASYDTLIAYGAKNDDQAGGPDLAADFADRRDILRGLNARSNNFDESLKNLQREACVSNSESDGGLEHMEDFLQAQAMGKSKGKLPEYTNAFVVKIHNTISQGGTEDDIIALIENEPYLRIGKFLGAARPIIGSSMDRALAALIERVDCKKNARIGHESVNQDQHDRAYPVSPIMELAAQKCLSYIVPGFRLNEPADAARDRRVLNCLDLLLKSGAPLHHYGTPILAHIANAERADLTGEFIARGASAEGTIQMAQHSYDEYYQRLDFPKAAAFLAAFIKGPNAAPHP